MRQTAHPEHKLDHSLDLLFIGRPVAGDSALDLVRCRLADRRSVLRCRQQHDPARLADAHRGLDIAREEESLHAHEIRLVELEQLDDQSVDGQEAFRHRQVRAGGEAPVVHLAEAASPPFDDPVTQRGRPRVDPEHLHPATSA